MAPARNLTVDFKNVIVGVLGTLITALVVGGWSMKANAQDVEQKVEALRSERRLVIDSVRYDINTLRELSLETLCEVKPTSRKCR